MADKKISALTGATTPLAGTEVLPIVQGGSTVKVSVANLTAGRAVAASLLTTTAASAIGTTADENVGWLLVDSSNKSYTITARGNDQSNARIRIKNTGTGGEDYAFVAGQNNVGNVGLSLFKVGVGTSLLLDDGSGNFNVSGGNVVIGTANKGIDFSANTSAAGMTSELLNWYEDGNYTPTVAATTGSITSFTASAYYTRIGRQVTVTSLVTITNAGTGAGTLTVSLPFTANGNIPFSGTGRENALTGSALQCNVSAGGTVANVVLITNATVINTGAQVRSTVTYFV